ncbi:MAG: hypothetical protein ABI462_03250 [Ignavibacteria bacterium]
MKIKNIFFVLLAAIVFYSCESNDSPTVNNNTTIPTLTTLLTPQNNSIISTLDPVFDWVDLNGSTYRLQVSTTNNFTSLILDVSDLTISQYEPPTTILNDSQTYFWRVRGLIGTDSTNWSGTFVFETSLKSINPTNKILIELFTNTSCIPCVEANQYLDAVYNLQGITSNDASVEILRIHTTLFAGDPFYLYNTPDNNARMEFYPNSAIVNPRTFLNGIFMGNYSPAAWTNKINEKLGENRTFAINLMNVYDTTSRSGVVNVKINQASGSVLSDLVYHIAISENEIPYAAPNGELHFNNTLRDLVTPPTGQSFNVSVGQTINFNQNYSIDNIIDQHKTDIIVFVQRTSTKEVMAVEKVSLP